ncbi:hypothetical protein Dimus_010380, partial [Dionaea muscipula]
ATPSFRPLTYHSPKWKIIPQHSVVLTSEDSEEKEALRHEWTRGAMTVKDVVVVAKLYDDSLNQLMTVVA